jgi:hypothetical protein
VSLRTVLTQSGDLFGLTDSLAGLVRVDRLADIRGCRVPFASAVRSSACGHKKRGTTLTMDPPSVRNRRFRAEINLPNAICGVKKMVDGGLRIASGIRQDPAVGQRQGLLSARVPIFFHQ